MDFLQQNKSLVNICWALKMVGNFNDERVCTHSPSKFCQRGYYCHIDHEWFTLTPCNGVDYQSRQPMVTIITKLRTFYRSDLVWFKTYFIYFLWFRVIQEVGNVCVQRSPAKTNILQTFNTFSKHVIQILNMQISLVIFRML